MKKQLVIKSERGLNIVTNLIAKKLSNKLSAIWDDTYTVSVQDEIFGKSMQIIITPSHHMIFKCFIDTVWEIIDEYEKKYNHNCITPLITTRPYLANDNRTWLHTPVVEINLRVMEV